MLESTILGYSRKTGKVPGPGEPKCQGTVYGNCITVYGHKGTKNLFDTDVVG
jgi:hypothetical protein